MEWIAIAAIVVLAGVAFSYVYYRGAARRHDASAGRPLGSQVEPAVDAATDALPEPAAEGVQEPAPGRLRALLQADLEGQPGYFATKWADQARYLLAVEISGAGFGTSTTHEIASGSLSFWRGGGGRTIHDAGYMISEEDCDLVKERLAKLLGSLHAEGWDVVEAQDWVRQSLPASDLGIQVRFADVPYDASPQPGTYERVLLSLDLYPQQWENETARAHG